MKKRFKPKEANDHYSQLENYAETRKSELSKMAEPYVKMTDRFGRLISRIVLLIGDVAPKDTQDIVIRDLMADVFDNLYESRSLVFSGKLNVAFPVARRAFESLSLLHLCTVDSSYAEKWQDGKKIENHEIRKQLGNHPMGESEEELRESYKFFCSATHPNRDLIPRRFLGAGNQYVLGAIGEPDLVMVCDYCIKILDMWFWLVATVSHFYKEPIIEIDKGYFEAYFQAHKDALETKKWLVSNFNKLLEEAKTYWTEHSKE
jgi:hypothetical protein